MAKKVLGTVRLKEPPTVEKTAEDILRLIAIDITRLLALASSSSLKNDDRKSLAAYVRALKDIKSLQDGSPETEDEKLLEVFEKLKEKNK